jgi:hypothetical protein
LTHNLIDEVAALGWRGSDEDEDEDEDEVVLTLNPKP